MPSFRIVARWAISVVLLTGSTAMAQQMSGLEKLKPGRVAHLGTFGPTYPIHEPDMLELILQRAAAIDPHFVETKVAQSMQTLGERQPGLPPVQTSARRKFRPTISLSRDIQGPNGLIAPAGTRLYPLDYAKIDGRWVFIDVSNPAQIKWTKDLLQREPLLQVVSVHGDPFTAGRTLGSKVFMSTPVLLERFGVERVPSVVAQIGREFMVEEVLIP